MKLTIDPIIVVEGKYDKIKLENIVEGIIFATDGFSIFKNDQARDTLRKMAETKGAIILTDSDRAGFLIRKYLHDILQGIKIYNLYIPDVYGKEKRKETPSAEGKLGVEGVPQSVLLNLLSSFDTPRENLGVKIESVDLYFAGLFGGKDSALKRRNFQYHLGLPARLNKNMLLKVLNTMFTKNEFLQQLKCFEKQKETL